MKSLIFTLLILSFATVCNAYEITGVEFYPNGAKFTFSIEPYDEEGNFKAVLPGAFSADSVRIINSDFVDGDFRVEQFRRTRWTPSNLEKLKTQSEEQTEKVKSINAKIAALEQTLDQLAKLKPDRSTPESLLDYIKNSQTLRLETEKEITALKTQLSIERDKESMLSSEYNSRRPRYDDRYIEISGRADDVVELSAFTSSALWRMKYILDLNSLSGETQVKMVLYASQKTGLDINGDIIFHTKIPDENITTPSINPLKVGIKPKKETIVTLPNASYSRTNSMFKSVKRDMVMTGGANPEIAEEESADELSVYDEIQDTLSDRIIRAEGIITGDGTQKKFEIVYNDYILKGKVNLTMIPEKRNNAWILVKMDEGNMTLSPGEAELRVDGQTTGKINIGEYGESQKEIPFGYAEQITIKKESLIEKQGVSWFSGVFSSGYKLEITNSTTQNRVVTVKDRLPIPIDDKIKLDVNKIEPKETQRDSENRLTWEIEVPAGATVPIIVDYKLSYPSGEELLYSY